MARRRKVRPSRHNRTVVLVQVVGLVLILAFVLIFRNNLGIATSALFESMAPEDVRVPAKDGSDAKVDGDDTGGASKAPKADSGAVSTPKREGDGPQDPSKTSDK